MAVIAPAGVVGRVVVPSAARGEGAAARSTATPPPARSIERSRAQGVVVGSGDDRLRLEYVSEVGRRRRRRLGGDLGHRRHLSRRASSSARVEAVEKSGGAYKRITVKPAVDFSALEEVLVVLTPTPAQRRGAGEPRVKAAGVILAIALALALQTTLARFLVRGTVAVDLVLVVVVYVALTSGPVTGLLTGHRRRAAPGRAVERRHRHRRAGEDDRRLPGRRHRHAVHRRAAAAAVRRVLRRDGAARRRCSWGCTCCSDLRHFGTPYAAVAGQALGNAVVGVVAFQLVELLPGAVERRRRAGDRSPAAAD